MSVDFLTLFINNIKYNKFTVLKITEFQHNNKIASMDDHIQLKRLRYHPIWKHG